MTSMEFHDIAQRNGFYQNGKAAYGYLNGYPVSMAITKVRMGAAMKDGVKATFLTEGALQAADIQNMNAQFKANGVMVTVPVSGNIEVTFPYVQNEAYAVGEQVFGAVTQAMAATGVRVKERCAVCGQENCDQIVLQGDAYVPVHSSCMVNDGAVASVETKKQGNVALSILGAFLGALVGAIPTMLTAILFSYVVYVLVMLIPLAAYQGYKIAKGAKTQMATVWAGVFSALALVVLYIVASQRMLIGDGYNVTFFEIIQLYGYMASTDFSYFMRTIVSELGGALFFLVLGIVSVAGQVSKDSKTAPQTKMQCMSAVPIPRAGMQAAQAFPGVEQGYVQEQNNENTPFPPVI